MFGITLDRGSRRSLALQLADGLRRAVVQGQLTPGAKLPPSRQLAEELGISRRLVTDAYEQLAGEGYFETRAGHGTYAAELPAPTPRANVPGQQPLRPRRPPIRFDFTPGIPDLAAFPRRAWRRAADESLLLARPADLSYGPPLGDARLREAIAAYLHRFRGLAIDPVQVCVTSGTSHSLALLSRVLPASTLHCEEPGLRFARDAFRTAGFACRSLEVDEAGAVPPANRRIPRGSLFYLTPSHQFPTGALLPVGRRMQFLELATSADGLVLEDDYDSEFRFRGSPVPPLASLDGERVVYLGTFSKSLAPFVRVGYLVAPPALVARVAELVRRTNLRGSIPHQRTLARFIEEGQVERHVFAMKRLYRARLAAIQSFLAARYGAQARPSGAETGFHLYVRFAGRRFGPDFTDACAEAGLRISTEVDFRAEPGGENDSLVIGYGNVAKSKLADGLELLAAHIEARAPAG